jgi:hypothetical protein
MTAPVEKNRDNLGYVLGWFCGGILVLGAIVSLTHLALCNYRKGFQAILLPLVVVAWLFIIMDGVRPAMPETEGGAAVWVLLLLGGIVLLPIIVLALLRRLAWPPAKSIPKQLDTPS